jgi:hypothetical protein
MHLLIFLDQPYKFRNPEDVDTLVSAQIPDPATHPTLYETVSTCMLHGPCGAKCMVNGKCSKSFPKSFCDDTHLGKMVTLTMPDLTMVTEL